MFILVFGGVRSGKSRYAVKRAKGLGRKVAYIATCLNPDTEMSKRIRLHQKSRPRDWKLIEEGRDLSPTLNKLKNRYDTVIIDCLGLLVSNLLAEDLKDRAILKRIKDLARCISRCKGTIILVSNEVGSGIVPENPLARRFRDLVGLANQVFAQKADEVMVMQAGIPVKIKDPTLTRGEY